MDGREVPHVIFAVLGVNAFALGAEAVRSEDFGQDDPLVFALVNIGLGPGFYLAAAFRTLTLAGEDIALAAVRGIVFGHFILLCDRLCFLKKNYFLPDHLTRVRRVRI
jgi:hypothetical protein